MKTVELVNIVDIEQKRKLFSSWTPEATFFQFLFLVLTAIFLKVRTLSIGYRYHVRFQLFLLCCFVLMIILASSLFWWFRLTFFCWSNRPCRTWTFWLLHVNYHEGVIRCFDGWTGTITGDMVLSSIHTNNCTRTLRLYCVIRSQWNLINILVSSWQIQKVSSLKIFKFV